MASAKASAESSVVAPSKKEGRRDEKRSAADASVTEAGREPTAGKSGSPLVAPSRNPKRAAPDKGRSAPSGSAGRGRGAGRGIGRKGAMSWRWGKKKQYGKQNVADRRDAHQKQGKGDGKGHVFGKGREGKGWKHGGKKARELTSGPVLRQNRKTYASAESSVVAPSKKEDRRDEKRSAADASATEAATAGKSGSPPVAPRRNPKRAVPDKRCSAPAGSPGRGRGAGRGIGRKGWKHGGKKARELTSGPVSRQNRTTYASAESSVVAPSKKEDRRDEKRSAAEASATEAATAGKSGSPTVAPSRNPKRAAPDKGCSAPAGSSGRGRGAGRGIGRKGWKHGGKKARELVSGPVLRQNRTTYAYGNHDPYYSKRYDVNGSIDPRVDALLKTHGQGVFAGKTIIDFGCGSGFVPLLMAAAGAERVVGVDIDVNLITQALKQLRYVKGMGIGGGMAGAESGGDKSGFAENTTESKNADRFPTYAIKAFRKRYNQRANKQRRAGETPGPPFPYNLEFRAENVLMSEIDEQRGAKYDMVVCLQLTKWVHLHWGDEGAKMLFKRAFKLLKPGGWFVAEMQDWASYLKRQDLLAHAKRNRGKLKLLPEMFFHYLISDVGFQTFDMIQVYAPAENGNQRVQQRPLYLFKKAKEDVSAASVAEAGPGADSKKGVEQPPECTKPTGPAGSASDIPIAPPFVAASCMASTEDETEVDDDNKGVADKIPTTTPIAFFFGSTGSSSAASAPTEDPGPASCAVVAAATADAVTVVDSVAHSVSMGSSVGASAHADDPTAKLSVAVATATTEPPAPDESVAAKPVSMEAPVAPAVPTNAAITTPELIEVPAPTICVETSATDAQAPVDSMAATSVPVDALAESDAPADNAITKPQPTEAATSAESLTSPAASMLTEPETPSGSVVATSAPPEAPTANVVAEGLLSSTLQPAESEAEVATVVAEAATEPPAPADSDVAPSNLTDATGGLVAPAGSLRAAPQTDEPNPQPVEASSTMTLAEKPLVAVPAIAGDTACSEEGDEADDGGGEPSAPNESVTTVASSSTSQETVAADAQTSSKEADQDGCEPPDAKRQRTSI